VMGFALPEALIERKWERARHAERYQSIDDTIVQ
jgi:hypothetical protein